MRIEDSGKEQQQQQRVYDVGECVVESVVEHQNDESQHDAGAYPYNLHARACGQREDVRLTIRIAGTTDADPAEGE